MAAAAAAVAAAGTKWSEEDRLTRSIIRYWLFLCIGFSVALMAPTLAPKMKHAAVPSLPAGLDLPATCLTFAAATVLLQRNFARVLERNPSMAMPTPRLTLNPLIAWPLAIFTWLFATACFVSYLSFGADYLQWAAAGVASGANLAMATRAVRVSPLITFM